MRPYPFTSRGVGLGGVAAAKAVVAGFLLPPDGERLVREAAEAIRDLSFSRRNPNKVVARKGRS